MLEETMSNAQEIGQKFQDQTLDTVSKTQDAVVEAFTTWIETANKVPASADFTKQFPSAAEVIDSNFDFAQRILNNQRDFAHRIIAATAPTAKATAPKVKTAPAKAIDAPKTATSTPTAIDAPATAKKTAAKKTSAPRQQPGTAPT
jgi:hypothetical protein